MKPVLMIHEVREWMLELPLEDYIITFDDGLYSQFHFFEYFKKLKTEKYFFISTNIICSEQETQSQLFPGCRNAHQQFFDHNNSEHYMKWSQIHEIYRTHGCFVGGHSHKHFNYEGESLHSLYQNLTDDTQSMIEEFEKQQIKIRSFCYPYNKQYNLYETILKKHGIEKFFGKDRIAIEDLK